MRKLVLFMHTSLDGFVAGPNGEMDWINVDEDMFEYAGEQTDQSDTALYGRVTYQMMESYWPTAGDQPNATKHDKQHSSWYNKVAKVVLSKTMQGVKLTRVHIISNDLPDEIIKLKQAPGKNILIFGSPTAAHSLMTENLIDDYWLFVNPILLGQGIPLFKGIKGRTKLKFITSNTFSSGVVCLHYERKPDD
jgi:dihydrofolate reductase